MQLETRFQARILLSVISNKGAMNQKGFLQLVFLTFVILYSDAKSVSFQNCGSIATPLSIDILSCDEAPCKLLNGTYESVSTAFATDLEENTLSKEVFLMLFNIRQDLAVNPEPCGESSSVICPLKANTLPYEYNATMYIPSYLPTVDGYMVWRLLDNSGNGFVCFRVNIGIYITRNDTGTGD